MAIVIQTVDPFAAVVGALDRQPNLAGRSRSDIVIGRLTTHFEIVANMIGEYAPSQSKC